MKFSIANLLLVLPLLFMSGCGGHAVIKSSEKKSDYDQVISSLLVVIEESHLQRAFLQNQKAFLPAPVQVDVDVSSSSEARVAASNAKVEEQLVMRKKLAEALSVPAIALKEALISAFAARGISSEVQIVNLDRDRLALTKIARKEYGQKQILILNTSAFQTSQSTIYGRPYGPSLWTGRVSWEARLFDGRKAANSEGKPVWNAKTDFFLFSSAECSSDAFKTCSDRFAATLVQQMQVEGLVAEIKK